MAIRCKFSLQSVTRALIGVWDPAEHTMTTQEAHTHQFQVVRGDTPQDRTFFLSTPVGKLELGFVNPTAAAGLALGKKYYVTIEEALD